MRKWMLCPVLVLVLTTAARADIIALWNFNDSISGSTGGVLEFLVDRGAGTMYSGFTAANIGNAAGTPVNIQESDPAGSALRLSGSANNTRDLVWMVGTSGYESIVISFAAQRTSTGFSRNQFYYSIDAGSSWTAWGEIFDPPTAFGPYIFDLRSIGAMEDNMSAAFRIVFDGATSGSGNIRLDNLAVTGDRRPELPPSQPVPEPSSKTLTLVGMACLGAARIRRAATSGRRAPSGARNMESPRP